MESLPCLLDRGNTPTVKLFWKSGEKMPAARGSRRATFCAGTGQGLQGQRRVGGVGPLVAGWQNCLPSLSAPGPSVPRHPSPLNRHEELESQECSGPHAELAAASPPHPRTVAVNGGCLHYLIADAQRCQLSILEAKLVLLCHGKGQQHQNCPEAVPVLVHSGVRGFSGQLQSFGLVLISSWGDGKVRFEAGVDALADGGKARMHACASGRNFLQVLG